MSRMKAMRQVVVLFLVSILLLTQWGSVNAQSTTIQFFPETGHNVKGDFLNFYRSVADPLLLFGYPISEQITSKDGKTVQYFQRARFELHTELPENQRVQLSPLGRLTYQPAGQLDINNSSGCELFVTGYRCMFCLPGFLSREWRRCTIWQSDFPFEFHDNLIVQYFEKSRFEWRADRPEGQRVVITDLGRLYFDQLGEDQALLRPVPPWMQRSTRCYPSNYRPLWRNQSRLPATSKLYT